MHDGMRVLIVEDLPADAELIQREVLQVLPAADFMRVDNHNDFLYGLESYYPQLILSDYHLPHFDGMQALRLGLERRPEIPFVIVTGSQDEETAVDCMKAGAWDYILKEHLRRLGPAVLAVLERKRLRDEHHQATRKLQKREEQYRLLLESTEAIAWEYSIDLDLWTYVAPQAKKILGYDSDEWRDIDFWIGKLHPEDRRWASTYCAECTERGENHTFEYRFQTKNGDYVWLRDVVSVELRNGKPILLRGYMLDITERKSHEEQLEHLATHDALTGLANRTLLCDRLEQSIHFAKRNNRLVGVLLLDLDRFKIVNDSLGHSIGDELLCRVARRLTRLVRDADTVARLGGDEFAILLAEVAEGDDIGIVAQKIMENLGLPYRIDEREITLTPSLGVSLYPQDGLEREQLLRNADIAMSRAKEEGNSFRFYAAEMNLRIMETLELEADLRHALERNELFLQYQAKVDLTTGSIVGAEALLRWQHATRGLISPVLFIPLAEETGLILPIGEWVLQTVCNQLAEWQKKGLPLVPVAVNLSARQFRREGLAETIEKVLAESGIGSALLELELTESMIMHDPPIAAGIMQQIKRLGVRLALDDFGTGYSSLNYLRRFPVDYLKIDRSFINDVATDPSAAAVAASIVAIAHSLGLHAVAEGVETREQLEFLRQCGCDSFQGFYFSKPVAAEEFAALLTLAPGILENAS